MLAGYNNVYFKLFLIFNALVAPEIEITGPASMVLGDTGMEFKCQVDSSPAATIKWYRGSTEIDSFPKRTVINNNTMVRKEEFYKIQTVKAEDMDVYKCEASNEVIGKGKTVFKEINVECKVLFIIHIKRRSLYVLCFVNIFTKSFLNYSRFIPL